VLKRAGNAGFPARFFTPFFGGHLVALVMENITPTNYQYEELVSALASDTNRGKSSRNTVRHHQKVAHLDVVIFDIYGYWGKHRDVKPGEDTSPVKCYALYSQNNKDVILYSFPGSSQSFTDNLTKARAPFCEVVGSLVTDDDLLAELKALLKG
jgi:hypothetical protein